jgi:hypothetical protein
MSFPFYPSLRSSDHSLQLEKVNEPSLRTSILEKLNTEMADMKKGVLVRLPQPNTAGHCIQVGNQWTDAEVERFHTDKTLPRDFSVLDPEEKAPAFWIFDAAGCKGRLPEVELDVLPDFERYPSHCIFVFGEEGEGEVIVVMAKALEMVRLGPKRVKFVYTGDGTSVV